MILVLDWLEKVHKRHIDEQLLASYSDDIPNFLKKIYAARKVKEEDLSLNLSSLLQPDFYQMNLAIKLLVRALNLNSNIVIVGDFDADGATATALAIKALRSMGFINVDFMVPDRFKHGYGLSEEIVLDLKNKKNPNLIITVDNGISSIEGVKLARSFNIDVIVTDHHLPGKELPDANAIINPNLDKCSFASKNLAGVGVCFYLLSALKTHLQKSNYFQEKNFNVPDLRELLDLVALGTVADVVKLDRNNRILVKEGLNRIRKKECSKGIIAILELTKISIKDLQASDLGFVVAPKINAAGRLSDISQGVHCLIADDIAVARRYALNLEKFNIQRREKQKNMQEEALAIVNKLIIKDDCFAISLFDENWHEGIVGIVAGKIKEDFNLPCAIFAKSSNFLKGSIRSIAQINIKDLLDIIDRNNPNLIKKFGGHAMAAGLTIKSEDFEMFAQEFSKEVCNHLQGNKPSMDIITDGELDASEISIKNAKILQLAQPWGSGFEEPIFYGDFDIIEQKILAEKHLKLTLKQTTNNKIFEGIAFFQDKLKEQRARIFYRLNINSFRGVESLQLMIQSIKHIESETI